MKRLYILLALLIALMSIGEVSAQRSRITKTRNHQRTHRVVKKHRKSKGKKIRTAKLKRGKKAVVVDPRLNDPNYNPYLQCEDTCDHVHGIDLSHYQGEVFWETVGQNTKTAYVYLKATEGGDRIDELRTQGGLLPLLPSEESAASPVAEFHDAVSPWRAGLDSDD